MKVLKFGGTSVGSVNSMLSVKRIVEGIDDKVIVVVSALGGITDKLICTSKMAASGDDAYEKEMKEIVNRHIEMVYTVIPAGRGRELLLDLVNELLSELKDIFQGIYLIRDLSPKTSATIVSYGERLSSSIVTVLIKDAVWFDSRTFIKTEKKHNRHILDSELTSHLVREAFKDAPSISIVPGFISTDKQTGEVTNLGRGGSDTTAVALAAALHADACEIYTDVEGVYTADPRVVPNAKKMKEITYDEMLELATLGAKVLHNRSVELAKKYGVQLVVRSSLNRAEGTVVKEETEMEGMLVSGVAVDKNAARIAIIGIKDEPGMAFKIFDLLAKKNINVDIILQSIGRDGTKDISFTVSRDQMDEAVKVLKDNAARVKAQKIEADPTVAKLSIVGAGMQTHPGVAAGMFEALYNVGVNIRMIGTSEIRVTVLVDEKDVDKAMRAAHDKFIED